jgi:N-acetylmuramoyl-L-alanine amidase
MIKINNKKKLFALLIVFILIFQQFSVFAAGIKLEYDGKAVQYKGNTYQILINKSVLNTDLPGIVFNKTVSIPLRSVFEKLGATAIWNNKTGVMNITYKTTKLQFTNNSSYVKVNGKSVKMASPAKKVNTRLIIPASFLYHIPGLKYQVDDIRKTISIFTLGTYQNLNYSRTAQEDDIIINASNMIGYNISRQVSANKLVLDLKNVKGPAAVRSLAVKGSYVTSVSVSSTGADITRLTVQLTGFHNYSVESTNSGCILKVIKSPYPQMSYYNNLDKVFISLNGIKLTDLKMTGNDTSLVNLFTESYSGNQYTITAATSSAINMSAGEFNMGDTYLDKIIVVKSPETGTTSITFRPKSNCRTLYKEWY